uniref:Uncharacterized protein n=1 Tax=Romanomermis culicivorax TaxID=13658 RepID=A0A915IX66_ROMCU
MLLLMVVLFVQIGTGSSGACSGGQGRMEVGRVERLVDCTERLVEPVVAVTAAATEQMSLVVAVVNMTETLAISKYNNINELEDYVRSHLDTYYQMDFDRLEQQFYAQCYWMHSRDLHGPQERGMARESPFFKTFEYRGPMFKRLCATRSTVPVLKNFNRTQLNDKNEGNAEVDQIDEFTDSFGAWGVILSNEVNMNVSLRAPFNFTLQIRQRILEIEFTIYKPYYNLQKTFPSSDPEKQLFSVEMTLGYDDTRLTMDINFLMRAASREQLKFSIKVNQQEINNSPRQLMCE